MHKTIKKVTEDTEKMKFNTAIATLMSFINDIYKKGSITRGELRTMLILLNPTAPHITEEMWQIAGFGGYINEAQWPAYDEEKTRDNEIEIVLQVNGKIKGKLLVGADMSREEIEKTAMDNDILKTAIDGKQVVKVIVVPGKLVNVVVK